MARNEAGSDALASIEARENVQRHANNSLYTETRLNLQGRRLVQRFAFSPPVALTIVSLVYGVGRTMNCERLPNRRGGLSFNFLHDCRTDHTTATRCPDGRLAEIFFDVGKAGSIVQQHAEATAVLASLALQHGVAVQTITHAVAGRPLATALELAVAP